MNRLGALLLLVPLAGPARSADVAAVITALEGRVEVRRAGGGSFESLKRGDFLYNKDAVRTGKDGKCALSFTRGLEIRVNVNTTYEIEPPDTGTSVRNIRLQVGQLWGRLLHRGGRANIRTDTAVAAVRGTSADFEKEDKAFNVIVYDGEVDVANAYGKTTLGAGQSTTVGGPLEGPSPPKNLGKGDLPNWQNDIEPDGEDELLEQLEGKEGEQPDERRLKVDIEHEGEKKSIRLKFKKGQGP